MSKGYKPTYRRSKNRTASLIGRIVLACAVLGIAGIGTYLFIKMQADPAEQPASDGFQQPDQARRVTFVAVGDNLPEIVLGAYADACAGELDDGLYDYRPLYSAIKPYVEKADLAYINFETHAGGDDIGPRGYPSFNTSDAMVDAVSETGFDLIASATNHSYDWGQKALEHSVSLWKQKPVLYTGMATTPEDAYSIHTYEKNGIIFSLLDYTYGVNGYEEYEIPDYAINFMHEDRIRADIAKARELSDIVIVAMHWGTENQVEPDSEQLSYAQLIADAGADLILGSHPHVIGPLVWLEGAGGNRTLVAYSLGNFLSRHEAPSYLNELEGMLQCDFVKDENGTHIENIRWTPLVNHSEEGNYRIYALKDYTPEIAARHSAFSGLEDPIAWLKETSTQIIGSNFTLDY